MPLELAHASAFLDRISELTTALARRRVVAASPPRRSTPVQPPSPCADVRADVDRGGATDPAASLLSRREGPRFDDTVALPVDLPRRLDEVIRSAGTQLRALPEAERLSHRTVQRRAHVDRVFRQALQARARLVAGTYGRCLQCARPISLATLSEKPWAPRCVYCALDL
ncbi:hypothetical protein FE634_18315 [Nocardioides dongxiaopingii]|uniref:hypothetical protein n=1 Tax=Nocardioides sp. S-1144 TaxID=2582905 RepID=UPI00110EB197|nr:hypothetical protein [Nocardioides sp. S-1144]QCW51878.1 hypothetical protein FE634_18315 [Nocardioides sp. S-1144]